MYKNKSNTELKALLDSYKSLTFDSQIKLNEELKSRDKPHITKDLESEINRKNKQIKDLIYVKDEGFIVDLSDDIISISRNTKATIIDIIAIFLGIILCFIGVYGFFLIYNAVSGGKGFQLTPFFLGLFFIGLGKIGIDFLNVLKRLIDYLGFKLIKDSHNNRIILKKRIDLNLVEIIKDKRHLNLVEENDKVTLLLEDESIISASLSNLTQKRSLEELYKNLIR